METNKASRECTRKFTVSQQGDQVNLSMSIDDFIDLMELLRRLEESNNVDGVRMLDNLNDAFKTLIAKHPHYVDENLRTLGHFTQIGAILQRHHRLIYDLMRVTEDVELVPADQA